MSIESIDHLYIETPSFEVTCNFWQGLGFKLIEQWGEDGHLACRLAAGNACIVLAEAETSSVTVHFHVSNIESYAKQIANDESVTVETSLEETHWGSRWIRVQDPHHQVFALEEPDRTV